MNKGTIDPKTEGRIIADKTVDVKTDSELKPDVFVLEQNYPNPFNPTTTINFSLPKTGRVSLSIFNILGQEVEVLIDKEMLPGRHSIKWKAAEMPSGIYLLRLQSGEFVETGKMTLIK
ncbi:MAG: T9SS type A sorting domain-containing protein [Bacteroidota bacterium]